MQGDEVVCVSLPRLRLRCAVEAQGGSGDLASGRPAALAPEPGRSDLLGETCSVAEASGVVEGMTVAEATARCPDLLLFSPDPELVMRRWESACAALEDIGAGVDAPAPGKAYFRANGLTALLGGRAGLVAAARDALKPTRMPATLGMAPTRFCSAVAAVRAQAAPSGVILVRPDPGAKRFLAPLPITALTGHVTEPGAEGLVRRLDILGIRKLGQLAALPKHAVADRFGPVGLAARHLAAGGSTPIRPRPVRGSLQASVSLPGVCSQLSLEQALRVLVSRILSHRHRNGRTLRALTLYASLVGGGSWERKTRLRSATSEESTLLSALGNGVEGLPSPAESLRLSVDSLGPASERSDQATFDIEGIGERPPLAELLDQANAVLGRGALLRAVEVDPDSPLPERRAMLVPYSPTN